MKTKIAKYSMYVWWVFLVLTLTSKAVVFSKVDVPQLYGLTRTELTGKGFPGTDDVVTRFNEWHSVQLYFNGRGALAQISFTPLNLITLEEAEQAVIHQFGILLPEENRFMNDSLCAYRNLPGLVRTVYFEGGGSDYDSFYVSGISIFYNIEWNEDENTGFSRVKWEFNSQR